MSTPERRPQPDDRGYYGAGWQQQQQYQQQPQHQQHGGGPAGGGYLPPRPPRRAGDPTRAFAPGASGAAVAGAAIAVVGVLAVQALSGLLGMIGTSLYVGPFSSYGGHNVVLSFATAVFLTPFPFYAGAFLALAFLTPITRRSPLPVVLLRAVLGGAAGTLALALVGVVTGAYGAVDAGPRRLLTDVLTSPLQRGVPLTAMLLAAATVAWLWLGRPRGRTGRPTSGTPGTVRPADAVPPATVQPQQQQPTQQWAPPQQQWGPPPPGR